VPTFGRCFIWFAAYRDDITVGIFVFRAPRSGISWGAWLAGLFGRQAYFYSTIIPPVNFLKWALGSSICWASWQLNGAWCVTGDMSPFWTQVGCSDQLLLPQLWPAHWDQYPYRRIQPGTIPMLWFSLFLGAGIRFANYSRPEWIKAFQWYQLFPLASSALWGYKCCSHHVNCHLDPREPQYQVSTEARGC